MALQIFPALVLGIGMIFYPDSPRWLLKRERDEEAYKVLAKLRGLSADHPYVVAEVLDIKASIMLENAFVRDHYAGLFGIRLQVAQVGVPILSD